MTQDRYPEDIPADELVRSYLDSEARKYLALEDELPAGDADTVHDARVALRRMRSILSSCRSLLPAKWARALRTELAWVGTHLGNVRDADVLAGRIAAHMARSRGEEGGAPAPVNSAGAALKSILGAADDERVRRRAELADIFDTERYRAFRTSIVQIGNDMRGVDGSSPASAVLARRATKEWKELTRRAGKVHGAVRSVKDVRRLHRVRIQAKTCRYLAEVVGNVEGVDSVQFVTAMKAVQDDLGDFLDARALRSHVGSVAGGHVDPDVTREVMAIEARTMKKCLASWRVSFESASKSSARRWMKRPKR